MQTWRVKYSGITATGCAVVERTFRDYVNRQLADAYNADRGQTDIVQASVAEFNCYPGDPLPSPPWPGGQVGQGLGARWNPADAA